MRAYKNTKDSNKKSGSFRKTFEYEDQLDELFAKDPTIQPECTLSSNSTTVSKRSASDETDRDDDSSSSSTPEVPKKKASRSNASELVSLFKTCLDEQKEREKDLRERREQMHTERMQTMNSLIEAISSNRNNNAGNQSCHHSLGRKEWDPQCGLCMKHQRNIVFADCGHVTSVQQKWINAQYADKKSSKE
ncbi:hypothetical protein MAR_019250 [Mya arenaria]|uniref:Uncharacterized protein n=1 Tax=Mya arenaria TaxID=6604 RepID=A0ABY7EH25_MYAAR|nr:hypothetical protein MAR_019250 [Mya arenaria]